MMLSSLSRPCAKEWEKNARLDPLFAILSSPDTKGNRWDVEKFFATGTAEIDLVFTRMKQIGALPRQTRRFLDFGCGVGRLSRALRRRLDSGVGIDISARMIKLANQYNRDLPPIAFVRNYADDLRIVPSGSIDFVYSHIVLQHISNDLQRRFIAEFCRVLATGGVAAFQIPVLETAQRPPPPSSGMKALIPQPIKDAIKKTLGMDTETNRVTMQMYALSEPEITRILANGGCVIERLDYSSSTEPDHNGRIEFFDRDEAMRRTLDEQYRSTMLSGFYFIRKG